MSWLDNPFNYNYPDDHEKAIKPGHRIHWEYFRDGIKDSRAARFEDIEIDMSYIERKHIDQIRTVVTEPLCTVCNDEAGIDDAPA